MLLTISPTLKQHEAYEALKDPEIKFPVFGGGAGGGKTWLGCEWLLQMCYLFPGSKWFIGREELKRLMGSSYVTWNKVCKHHKIPPSDWKLNGQYNYIEFINGSRIDLLDLAFKPTDPFYERFGSLEYTGGWIEEAGEVHFKSFDTLKSRVGRHLNRELKIPPKLFITCNPKKNWIYSKVYRPFKAKTLSPKYRFIQSLYRDNPYTAKEYEEQLDEIEDKVTLERLKHGNWEYDSDDTSMIDYDAICDLFSIKKKEAQEKFIIVDVARLGKDKATVFLWEGFQVKRVIVYPKLKINTLQEHVRELANKEGVPRDFIIADEDGVGGGFVDNFGCLGFVNNSSPIQPPESKKNKSKLLNYTNLKAQCADLLAKKVNNRDIGIDKTDFEEEIKEELEVLRRDDVDKETKFKIVSKEDMKERIGRSPDFLDNMIMRMYFELKKPEIHNQEDVDEAADDFIGVTNNWFGKKVEVGDPF